MRVSLRSHSSSLPLMVLIVVLVVAVAVGASLAFCFPLMWLWNWIGHDTFGGPELTYWKTYAAWWLLCVVGECFKATLRSRD